jgi:hypothetical protein
LAQGQDTSEESCKPNYLQTAQRFFVVARALELHMAQNVVTVNFPPMPRPEDFGIEWDDMKQNDSNYWRKVDKQLEVYNRALEVWKDVANRLADNIGR